MPANTWVLILAGGKGTRLWPKSTTSIPKQFMSITPHQTLFQQTLARISALTSSTQIFVVSPSDYVPFITAQAPELMPDHVIVEPAQHGTTACLGFALAWLQTLSIHPDDVVLIVPTDTHIRDVELYRQCLLDAIDAASNTNGIVTIGVRPSYPATGYGYIQTTDEYVGPALRVENFTEKPSYERAKLYVEHGNCFWNAGIFAWKDSVMWNLLKTKMPSTHRILEQISSLLRKQDSAEIRDTYLALPKLPFEYAIVEHAPEVYMVPSLFEWSDVGTWSSLIDKMGAPDESRPVVRLDADNCLVQNDHGLVALLGVQDLIVVHTENTVFICHQSRDQDIKGLLELIQADGYEGYL